MVCVSGIIVPLLSGALGALIGTFGGAYLSFVRQEKSKRQSRKMAIKAIDLFQKYSKKEGTFNLAEQEFNNCISLAEKRTILVALHKLGIPVIVKPGSSFDINNVCFDKMRIDKDDLVAITNQIEKGLCDSLFFIDPDTYFNEGIRIATLRSLAKRWINEVLSHSSFTAENQTVNYPQDWYLQYSWGEKLALAVFKTRVCVNEYYDSSGIIIKGKIDQLLQEVNRGLWDTCLIWDIESYQSIQSTYSLNSQIVSMLQKNNAAVGGNQKS